MYRGHLVAAIVPAAGSGSRMGSETSKTWLMLNHQMMISWTLRALSVCEMIDEIIVVGQANDQDKFEAVFQDLFLTLKQMGLSNLPRFKFAVGGRERLDSVRNGIAMASPEMAYIMVHDGARPLVSQAVILSALDGAIEHGAAIAGVPAKDTIKRIDHNQYVVETPNRESLYMVQTPQCFERGLLEAAYEHAKVNQLSATDDSALVEAYGHGVKVTAGSYENIKVTTPEDQLVAEGFLLKRMREGQ